MGDGFIRYASRFARSGVGLSLFLSAFGSGPSLLAQGALDGPELQVNTYTTGSQELPVAGADAQGNFIVAWQSLGSDGADAWGSSVQAQRFSAAGVPVGGQFEVNSFTPYYQQEAAVAVRPTGDFVVAWEGNDCPSAPPCSFDRVSARRFDSAGAPQGDDIIVNTAQLGGPPEIAQSPSGSFIVVWHGILNSGTDTSEESIQARRYGSSGLPIGSQFQVNTFTESGQIDPDVAGAASGDFVVVWTSALSSGPDDSWSIQAQRIAGSGLPQGGEFQVNTYTTGVQDQSAVARDAVGNFVVVWRSQGSYGTDTDGTSLQARRFSQDGTPLGDEFQINEFTGGDQGQPQIAMDAQGSFMVVWQSFGSVSTDSDGSSIQARWFDSEGNPRGGQFQVNTYTTGLQEAPSVAIQDQGRFVFVWQSDGSSGTDSSSWSVHAQIYGSVFNDNFESADTSRWSSTIN